MAMAVRALLLGALVACGPDSVFGPPTESTCPQGSTLTYDNFGKPFMEKYCVWCHAEALPRSKRNGAPLFHDFDSLQGVLQTPDHIDQQTGIGPEAENHFMPPDRCPSEPGGSLGVNCAKPTDEERRQLAEWIACERNRPHTF